MVHFIKMNEIKKIKSKYIDVALSARIVTLRYDNISGQLYGNPYSASAYLRQFPSHTFFEPAFTLKEGWGKIRFYQQVVRNYKWSKADLDREKLSVVLGIQCMFKYMAYSVVYF